MNTLSSKSKLISRVLLSRPFSISSDSRVLCISFFSTSSHPNSPSNNQHFSASRRYEEESKNVRVSVWWDIENCAVPTGVNVYKISHFITSAVRANGIKGPVQVTAFGDVVCLSRANQEALSSTGVNLVHIPKGGKNCADRSLLVDLMYWVSQNPPPAHVFLISSDRDFTTIIHKLRMNNYNILLAAQEARSSPGVLCSAATIMWNWDELAKGENLSGRHFNQPPDGPFNSWYGHYRGPLEDPFDASEQKSCLEADNVSNSEQSSQPKRRPVPIPILRQIQRIVDEYPEGLTFNELRSAIAKYKVPIEKDIYSYKKFIRFLQSLPQIVRIETSPDGRMVLYPASRKSKKPVEGNDTSGLITENKNQDVKVTKKETDQTHAITRMVDVELVSPYVNHTEKTVEEKVKEEIPEKKDLSGPHIDTQVTSKEELSGKEIFDEQAVKISVPPMEEQISESKIGLFKRLWFGTATDIKETSNNNSDKLDTSYGNPVLSTPKEEDTISSNQHGVQHSADASPINVLDENAKSDASDKCETSPGIFTRVLSWFKSWRNSSINATNEQTNLEQISIEGNSRKLDDNSHSTKLEPDMFYKDTFWNALQSFFKTRKGVDIISSSTSREHFAERLQKEGPLVLQTLQESDLHNLVDLLIFKRWIKEFPTKTPRFTISQPAVDSSVEFQPQNVQSQSSKGLSSMFMGSSQENQHLTAASAVHKKPSEKSRSDVLADCQRLLYELLPRNPEGLNIGYFKRDFLDKYGYPLDHQKLGYPKLVSLLQIMPGVKVLGRYILKDNVVYSPGIKSVGLSGKSSGSDSDLSDSQKNEGGESSWEELGPVTEQARDSNIGRVNGNYEPSLSDDDNEFSEPEENATSSTVNAEERNRSKVNKDDSSLIQILESWYATNDSQDRGSHVDFLVDGANKNSKASKSSNASFKSESDSDACEWKQRPQKNYNFVANPIENETDDTIQGILGTLKKSGKPKEHE